MGLTTSRIGAWRNPRSRENLRGSNPVDRLWLAITGVAIGFIVLDWPLFAERASDKITNKP
jgi:hypothetical protein